MAKNTKTVVTFRSISQTTQEIGTTDEHLLAQVSYDAEINGKTLRGSLAVKQVVGGIYGQDGLEVQVPIDCPIKNYEALRRETEAYYRSQVGAAGQTIRIPNGGRVAMQDNAILSQRRVEIEETPRGGGSW